jgi:type IV pilus assembly protein PilN
MRIEINLASRPYEDVAEFYRTWGMLVAAMVLITIALAGLTFSSVMSARTVGQQTGRLRSQITELDREKQAAQDMLNRPENRETRDRSRFLNTLIARKAFSWTQVFADLEKIIPAHVHVLSITPGITDDNQIQVAMHIEADSREKSIELIRRLEESKTFRQPQMKSESSVGATPGVGRAAFAFDIVALYTPRVPPVHEPKAGSHGGMH